MSIGHLYGALAAWKSAGARIYLRGVLEEAAASVREQLLESEIWVALEGETVRGFVGLQRDYIAGIL